MPAPAKLISAITQNKNPQKCDVTVNFRRIPPTKKSCMNP